MPITRETRATVRAGMAAIVAAADLRAGIGMIAGRGGMDRRVRAAGAMTNAGRVPVDRRKVGGAMIVEEGIVVEAEAGAISSSSAIVTGSPRLRWCGRRR